MFIFPVILRVCPTESLFAFLALLNRKSKKKLVDAMGFSEFKLDPTKQNKTTSLIYIYNCKEKRKKKSPNYQIIWSSLRVEWSLWVL